MCRDEREAALVATHLSRHVELTRVEQGTKSESNPILLPRVGMRCTVRDIDDLEIAVAEYVDWFNHRRIHDEIGYVPPAEYEAQHAAVEPPPQLVDDLVDAR